MQVFLSVFLFQKGKRTVFKTLMQKNFFVNSKFIVVVVILTVSCHKVSLSRECL